MRSFRKFVSHGEYDKLVQRLGRCCDLRPVGTAQGYPVYETVLNPRGSPTLVILSGIHGNERSGPLGVAHWLESKPSPRQRVVVLPCCNPSGYEYNTRASRSGKDINRHFTPRPRVRECCHVYGVVRRENPKLVLAMHENLEDNCFLYYTSRQFTPLCRDIIRTAKTYFPIFQGSLNDNGGNPTNCTRSDRGLVFCTNSGQQSLEDRLYEDGIAVITTELPTKKPMPPRIHLAKKIIELACHSVTS